MKTRDLPLAALHELTLLRDHMLNCAAGRGPLYRLQCVAETVDGFLAPRFVTTLGVLMLMLAGALLVA